MKKDHPHSFERGGRLVRPSHACLHCRIANKAGGACPECRQPMECIGHSWRAPKRSDVAGWKAMGAFVALKRRGGLPASATPTFSVRDTFNPFAQAPRKRRQVVAEDAYQNSAYLKRQKKRDALRERIRQTHSSQERISLLQELQKI